MTDLESLFHFRIQQAEETLQDAQKLIKSGATPRSITNRAYYAVFYAILALLIKENIALKTSKHSGVIAVFNKEFVKTKKFEKHYSEIVHYLFRARQEVDYKDFVNPLLEDAEENLKLAKEFVQQVKKFIG